jgi:cyclophilin family peptidyl-prolyl cis-trans isomerase
MKYLETIGGRISVFLALLLIIGITSYFYFMDNNTTNELDSSGETAIFYTNMGNFEIEFFSERSPKTVENFKKLASEGFYNGVKFHRIIKDFMIQGGDPLTKDDSTESAWGTGGPGYMFEDEISELNKNIEGTISMANAGPNTNGSQFFINTTNNNFLDGKHTVFGKIIKGKEVVDAIEMVETKERDIPVIPIVIEKIELK